jgi:hypothetical protein
MSLHLLSAHAHASLRRLILEGYVLWRVSAWSIFACYQCCGSGMFIPEPDFFFPSQIPDLTKKKEQRKNKLLVLPFLVENYLIF